MSGIKVGNIIKMLRKQRDISQEALAEKCQISVQAVSKWETGQSYPDICLLPVLAEYFGVTIDYLLTEQEVGERTTALVPVTAPAVIETADMEDDTLYIVQCRNGRLLNTTEWERDKVIRVAFEEDFKDCKNGVNITIVGNADVDAEAVVVNVSAGGTLNCEDVSGNASAGGTINCSDVSGNVAAGATVNCDDVEGNVAAGAGVTCGDVEGNVTAGTSVSCDDVGGDVKAGTTVTCGDVEGNVYAKGAVTFD